MKAKTIRIYHENKMLISDWIMFITGLGFVFVFLVSMINVINNIEGDSNRLVALIVLLFAFTKVIFFVKPPTHYTTRDLIEDIKI